MGDACAADGTVITIGAGWAGGTAGDLSLLLKLMNKPMRATPIEIVVKTVQMTHFIES